MLRSWIIALVIAVLAAGWIASGLLADGEAAQSPPPEAEAPARVLPTVRIAALTAEPMTSELALQGRTLADRRILVRAEVNGVVESVAVARGDTVEPRQRLLQIETGDRAAALAEARALLRQRQVEYNAAARLNEQGFRADTSLAGAQALLDSARAMVERAELALEDTSVEAPFAGVINDRLVEVGDYVSPGDPLYELVDLDPLRIAGQVSERYLGQIERGTLASATLVDGSDVDGMVSFVGTVADPNTRTFRVEMEVSNPDGRVIEGLSAAMMLPIAEVTAHYVTPAIISLNDDGVLGVKTVDDDGIVRFLPAQIVGGDSDGVWLAELPSRFDAIVVGHEFVTEGTRVETRRVELTDGGFN